MSPAPARPRSPLEADSAYNERQLRRLADLETLILAEGFLHLTIAVIAERLRCSRRSLYELAESKDALVLMVIDRLLHRVALRAHEAMALGVTHFDRLRAFMTVGVLEYHRATVAYSQDVADEPAVKALVDRHFAFAAELSRQMVADGIAAGEFAHVHPQIAAEVLGLGLARMQDPDFLRATGLKPAEAFDGFLTLFADGLRLAGPHLVRDRR